MINYLRDSIKNAVNTFVFVLLFVVALCCSVTTSYAQAFKWETVKHNSAEYVTLRSVKEFYRFDRMKVGAKVSLENVATKIEFKSGSQNCYMNGVLFQLSSPIVKKGARYLISRTDLLKLVDPVIRPAHIIKANPFGTVVIDPGHGGRDGGAKGTVLSEKFYALQVSRLVRDKLQAKGYKVVMTRNSDVFVSRQNRVRIANSHPNAVFVSVHFNSFSRASASGIETFTVSPVGVPHIGRGVRRRDYNAVPGNIIDSASIALATAVHSRVLLFLNDVKYGNDFNIIDRGIKRARFDVLQGIKIPSILIEGGFLSNRLEARKVHTRAYQETLANAIVRGIDIYRSSVSKKR